MDCNHESNEMSEDEKDMHARIAAGVDPDE